jgi:hypothetical protein
MTAQRLGKQIEAREFLHGAESHHDDSGLSSADIRVARIQASEALYESDIGVLAQRHREGVAFCYKRTRALMATTIAPVRLDREIDAAAREEAQLMSRSVAEQVSHWARLGRELERSPGLSLAHVQAVLRGETSYDALNVLEQAAVRTAWAETLAEKRANLNLAQIFDAEGHDYAGLDENGEIQIVTPRR